MKKIRLDNFLSEQCLSRSREKAKKEIIAGWVKVNGETVRDPAKKIFGNETIDIKRPRGDFVSRGGEKLLKAIKQFEIELSDMIVVDFGASTGGFTDCLLQNGVRKVYAIDVGYGQLDYKLQTDDRVVVMDRTNVRNLNSDVFLEPVDFITMDLSFISVVKVMDIVKEIFAPIKGVILLKPQFEAQTGEHKKGVVRKKEIHENILKRTLLKLSSLGLSLLGLTFSPIKGPAGNIEFLLYFFVDNNSGLECSYVDEGLIAEVVGQAHQKLNIS